MKKTLILIALILNAGFALATDSPLATTETAGNTINVSAEIQKEKTIIVYDVYKHMENSSNIFLGMGGLSMGIGAGLAASASGNQITLGAGLQTFIWGAVETGLGIFYKNFNENDLNPESARLKYVEMSGWHAVFDLAIMATGGCIAIFGNDSIKGHGLGIMLQGAMLATYDGLNFFIASSPQDVKNWGAGIGYNIRFAGL